MFTRNKTFTFNYEYTSLLSPIEALRLNRTVRVIRTKLWESGRIHFVFVSMPYMVQLGRGPTDVLAFPKHQRDGDLGLVFINVDYVQSRYKKSMWIPRMEELSAPAMLHLHGFTHDNTRNYELMRRTEIEVLGRPCLPKDLGDYE